MYEVRFIIGSLNPSLSVYVCINLRQYGMNVTVVPTTIHYINSFNSKCRDDERQSTFICRKKISCFLPIVKFHLFLLDTFFISHGLGNNVLRFSLFTVNVSILDE